jgi:hypothetical protein
VLICIDEGQRITPSALSSIKNSLERCNDFLIVLSLLVFGLGDVVKVGRTDLDRKAQEAARDFGASGFFVDGIALGPFDTPEEARACIAKRLENNIISFTAQISADIAYITDRLPRKLISLSFAVYKHTHDQGCTEPSRTLLYKAFQEKYDVHLAEASSLCEATGVGDRKVLRALTKLRREASAAEVTQRVFPTLDEFFLTRS